MLRTRQPIALATLLIILMSLTAWRVLQPREPTYQGKPLSAWLAALDLQSPQSSDSAIQAVRAIGTNSLPWLTQMLRARDPAWKKAIISFNTKQPYLQLPVTPASAVQNRAVQAYIALESAAKQNVPELIQILESESSPQVRSGVAAALGSIGPEAKAAVPALLKASQDKNPEVHKNAVWALANIQRWAPDPFR